MTGRPAAPPVIPGLRPEPDRDRFGRYMLPAPDGTSIPRPWTRATTLAHLLDDTTALTKWKRRMVLQGAALDPTLLQQVPHLMAALDTADTSEARDLKAALDAVCDAAADLAGANAGSGWGTALHSVTEWADAGRLNEILVPIDLAADLAIYQETLDRHHIGRPRDHIERIVVNTTTGTAGTYDRLLRLPDGRLVVGDLKSQQYVYDWLGIAMQLAQYAHADGIYNPAINGYDPMPPDLDITRGLIIHLPARSGTCTLYEVDLTQGWEAAKLAAQVKEVRSRSRHMGWKWQPPRQTELHLGAARPDHLLLEQIAQAVDPETLVNLWRLNAATWTPELTAAAAARKRALEAA